MTTKTNSIHVRMTPTEYDVLKGLINLERMSISKFIRRLIRDEGRRQGLLADSDEAQGST